MSEDATLDEFRSETDENDSEEELTNTFAPKVLAEVPEDWEKISLAEIADDRENSFVDGPFGANLLSEEYHDQGFARTIKLQNIRPGEFVDTNRKYVTEEKFSELSRHGAYPGEIAIAKMAEPVARACLLPGIERQYILAAADCVKLDPAETFNSLFVMYALNSRPVWKQAFSRARGTGRKRINLNQLKEVQIPTPSIEEQRKIATVLYNIDSCIENTEKVIDQTKRVKEGVAQDLFERGLTSGHDLRPVPAQDPSQFEQHHGKSLPVGWKVERLADVGEWISGNTPKRSESAYWGGSIPWITAKDMKKLRVGESEDKITERAVENGATVVSHNSVLVLVRGMILAHTLPVVRPQKATSFNQDVKAILPHEEINPDYLAYWLVSNEKTVLALITAATHGTKRLSTEAFGNLRIPIPPADEQSAIVNHIVDFDRSLEKERSRIASLKRLKRGLMQDFLSGTVRTTDKHIEVLDEVLQHG